MNVLLSAYACEPNKGSEPGVGWHWALEIAKRGHKVFVLTRANNKSVIDKYYSENSKPNNLNFLFYDLPPIFTMLKKYLGVHFYYFFWQWRIVKIVRALHENEKIDLIHHITFVTIHQPSFLHRIKGVKFVYGPAAGGDIISKPHLVSFPILNKLRERLRVLQCKLLRFDFLRIQMFKSANLVICTSQSTSQFLPTDIKDKVLVNLAIGIDPTAITEESHYDGRGCKRLLYVGNFLHIKGVHLLLKAFKKLTEVDNYQLTLIGSGMEKMDLQYSGMPNLKIVNWISQKELMDEYSKHDLFVFPAFRDSGGMVVLEAMAKGLPVICFNEGGPSITVDETCGIKIDIKSKSEDQIIDALYCEIIKLNSDYSRQEKLHQGALMRAKQFTWEKSVSNVYSYLERNI